MVLNKDIVKAVEERAGHYCETCGLPATESMALHHRKLKSRGGKDSVANLIRVHHECHNLGSMSIHAQPTMSTNNGWMVSSWRDPEDVPLLLPDGSWALFKNDGTVQAVVM